MSINWSTFLLEILNFLVLLWILKHFLYRPVLDVIARRKAAIEKTLADATAREKAGKELESRYQGRLDEWAKEKDAARAELTHQLDAERSKQFAALKASLEAERQNREAAAERTAQQARLAMEHEAARNGAGFASALLRRLAGPETSARLTDLLLEDLAALSAEQVAALRAQLPPGGATARVVSAVALDAAARERVTAAIGKLTGTAAAPTFVEDAALLAGLRIELGTWSLGANLADELAAFADLADAR